MNPKGIVSDQEPPAHSLEADYIWCRGQRDLLAQHAGQVVVFHNRTLVGSGADHHEAMKDVRERAARENRPVPSAGLLFVVAPEPIPTGSAASVSPPDSN
jgi:hypothetical protein